MIQEIDGIKFKLKEPYDFSFLVGYGKVFQVFDDQDSGNICFGTEKDGKKYFIKFAGARTAEYDGEPCDAVGRLKATVPVYEKLRHKSLIEYIGSKEVGDGFAMIFKWADGACMGRMWGSSVFMSPEEFKLGAAIDEITNVYTMGAMAFALFGNYKRNLENWSLSEALFHVAVKAIQDDREKRQASITGFINEWKHFTEQLKVG